MCQELQYICAQMNGDIIGVFSVIAALSETVNKFALLTVYSLNLKCKGWIVGSS